MGGSTPKYIVSQFGTLQVQDQGAGKLVPIEACEEESAVGPSPRIWGFAGNLSHPSPPGVYLSMGPSSPFL